MYSTFSKATMMHRSFVVVAMILAIWKASYTQFINWNSIYSETDESHQVLHTDLFRIEDGYLSLGIWNNWVEWGGIGRIVDTQGAEISNNPVLLPYWPNGSSGNNNYYKTSDNGYLATLVLENEWSWAYPYLIKLDTDLDTIWTRRLLFMADSIRRSMPFCFLELQNSELLLICDYYDHTGFPDSETRGYRFTRLNQDGDLLYDHVFEFEPGMSQSPLEAYQLASGEIVAVCKYFDDEYDIRLSKFDLDGNELEYMMFGNPDDCVETQARLWYEDDEHIYVLYQHCLDQPSNANGLFRPFMFEFDAVAWEVGWQHQYDEIDIFQEYGAGASLNGLTHSPESGFAAVMTTSIPNTTFEVAILKADSEGNFEWYKNYDPPIDAVIKQPTDIVQAPDSGYVVTGVWYSDNEPYIQRNWMFKTDPCGDIQWVDCPGGVGIAACSQSAGNLYPNPAKDQLFFDFPFAMDQAVISNMYGQLITQLSLGSASGQIDISGICPGMYIIVFKSMSLGKRVMCFVVD
jgi:hypothetical protein